MRRPGSVVVSALACQSEGWGIDSRWTRLAYIALESNYYYYHYYLFSSDTSDKHKQHEARSIVNTNTHLKIKNTISINNSQQAWPKV